MYSQPTLPERSAGCQIGSSGPALL